MRTFLRLKQRQTRRLPEMFRGEELRYPDELVATFLRHYTRPGDVVLDPFAGYGTTLLVAETMGRLASGVEADARRVAYARGLLARPAALVLGDARRLGQLDLPPCDLVMTSPPFMGRWDSEYPLDGYAPTGRTYEDYLRELAGIFAQVRALMRPGAHAVLEVANLREPAGITTLAWDTARSVGEVLEFAGEVVIGWDNYAYGYDHSYCLLFRRPPDAAESAG
jgi:tRNA G10  N-methylase Trm11